MTGPLAGLLDLSSAALLAAGLVFLRVGAVMALMPAFGEQVVPMRVRLALTLAFTAITAPAVAAGLPAALGPLAALGEVVAGLALGMVLRLAVLVLQIAGQVAAQSTSLAQIFGGAAADPQPAFGRLAVMAGLALAVMAGLHLRVAEALILSYRVLPAGGLPDAAALSQWGVARIAGAFGFAVTLAMPFVAAGLIYNLALGVINRAMPQLMVVLVGAPALTGGGLVLMALALPVLLSVWQGWLEGLLSAPFAGAGG